MKQQSEKTKDFFFLPSPYKIKLKENLKRHLWFFVQKYFVATSPKCFSKYRISILRLFGAKIGKNCYIAASTYIHLPWNLVLKDHVTIDEKCYLQGEIIIGSHTSIGNNVHIISEGHNVRSRYFEGFSKTITIGNCVFIGGDAYIARGVYIGDFSVIGAKSVLWHNIPENTIAYGNPCKIKSERIPLKEYSKYRYE